MPATLLLADNNTTLARLVTLSFESEDIRVVSVTDGREAVKLIDLDPPDIVLAEIGTAHVDGYGVATHVKSSTSLRHIPVLLLSGAFEPVDEVKARSTGCDGILVKPFDPRNLVQRVKALLAAKDEALAAAAMAAARAAATSVPVVELPADTPTELPPVLDLAEIDFDAPSENDGVVPSAGQQPVVDLQFDALDAALANLDAAPKAAPPEHVQVQRPAPEALLELPVLADLPDLDTLRSFEEPIATTAHPPEPVSFASRGDEASVDTDAVSAFADIDEPHVADAPVERVTADAPVEHEAIASDEAMTLDESHAVSAMAHRAPVVDSPAAPAKISLSGAFATFLSEEVGPASGSTPLVVWPPPAPRAARDVSERPTALPSGQALEEIVRRVLTEMTGDAVRTIVRDTAERLVREEIERIKAHPE